MANRGEGFRIFRRETSDGIETEGGIGHVARDRAHHVAVARQRHHARIRHQPDRGFDPDQPLRRGGVLDRAAGLFGQPHHAHMGGNGTGRACARAAGRAVFGHDVQRGAGPAVIGMGAGPAEDRHVGLAQNDGIGRLHSGGHRRIPRGHQIGAAGAGIEQRPARGGGKADHIDRVLDHHRNSGQGTQSLACGAAAVHRTRGFERGIIHENDGIILLVQQLDLLKAGQCQLFRREGSGGKSRTDRVDRQAAKIVKARHLGLGKGHQGSFLRRAGRIANPGGPGRKSDCRTKHADRAQNGGTRLVRGESDLTSLSGGEGAPRPDLLRITGRSVAWAASGGEGTDMAKICAGSARRVKAEFFITCLLLAAPHGDSV